MLNQFSRTELLLGKDAVKRLENAHVAIFGIGGVGGYTAEALARSGVGKIDLIDPDRVSVTNINRQIYATTDTVGMYKTEVAKKRIEKINPAAEVFCRNVFFLPENADMFDFSEYDYVVDAIDTVTGKIGLVIKAKECKTPIISAMGAGNKLDPAGFTVADIYETSICPLARVMRRELKKRGVKSLKVVYSKEKPIEPKGEILNSLKEENPARRQVPGSCAFVPAVCGLIIAGEVVRTIAGV